jgi:hypothetical protein
MLFQYFLESIRMMIVTTTTIGITMITILLLLEGFPIRGRLLCYGSILGGGR